MQVCWLAYQGTTGLLTIDYRLTDPYLDPPGLHDDYYSEESVAFPTPSGATIHWPANRRVSTLPALDKGYITFGCLNNFCKVNVLVLRLWAQVFKAVDRSQLVLLAAEGSHRRHTLDVLEQEGVKPDRVTFVAHLPRPQYLELYHHIDIGLDTFPYNGQTTSLDAFWLGVPVITIVGQTAVGRAGLSLLRNLGLPELVAETPEQFGAPREHRRRVEQRLATSEEPPGDPARSATELAVHERPTLCPERRGGLPRYVAALVWRASILMSLGIMATIPEALAIAVQHYRAGSLHAAAADLSADPRGRAESSRYNSSSRRDCSPNGQARGCHRIHWTGDRIEQD